MASLLRWAALAVTVLFLTAVWWYAQNGRYQIYHNPAGNTLLLDTRTGTIYTCYQVETLPAECSELHMQTGVLISRKKREITK